MARRGLITVHSQSTAKAVSSVLQSQSLPFSTKAKKQTLQTYKDEKKAKKEYRTKLYHKAQERKSNLPNRRKDNPNRNVMKKAFRSWFDNKRNLELYWDRLAKRQNQEWKIKLGLMIERLPVVTEDDEDWELDYYYMKAHFDRERSIVYPKEIEGFSDPMDYEILTKEELMGVYFSIYDICLILCVIYFIIIEID